MSFVRSALLALGALVLLAACSGTGSSQAPAQSPSAPNSTASAAATPIPAALTVTPQAGTGVVRGRVLAAGTEQPLGLPQGVDIYLASVLKAEGGPGEAAILDRYKAPFASPNDKGEFEIRNVPPGKYVVAVVAPTRQVLARSLDKPDIDIMIEVAPDGSVDLGTIYAKYP